MIKATINGNTVEFPTSWEEVKFGQYLKLITAKTDTETMCAFLDLDQETIRKATFKGLEMVKSRMNFLKEPPLIDEKPTKLLDYIFPQDITFESVERMETLSKYAQEAARSEDIFIQNEMLAMYAAIYCVREFDEEKAKYLAKQYLDAPCLEVMSAGTFFHASILSLETGLTMNYLRRNIPMKKSKPGLKALMKRLGFTRPSIMWRAMWDTMTKKSSSGA